MQNNTASPETTPVWDVFIRLFHWALVISITVAAVTGFLLDASWINIHIWSAICAVALIATRIIWGFTGGTYARFASFVMSPRRVLAHVQNLRKGTDKRYIGHNPLGGVMVLGLLANILAIAVSGMILLGGVLKAGPLAAFIPYTIGNSTGEVHELLAFTLLALIAAHIGGVIYESRRHNENLAYAMVTGHKDKTAQDITAPKRNAHILGAALIAALVLSGGTFTVTSLSTHKPGRMPVAKINPLVDEECSACHMLFHPSLLPAKDWDVVTATLENHYGEDASLGQGATTEIRNWLMANAAETADTRPAHVFTLPRNTAGLPGAITDTPYWKHRHEELLEDANLFNRKSIRSKSNCIACHKDAKSGLFSPFEINIPKE